MPLVTPGCRTPAEAGPTSTRPQNGSAVPGHANSLAAVRPLGCPHPTGWRSVLCPQGSAARARALRSGSPAAFAAFVGDGGVVPLALALVLATGLLAAAPSAGNGDWPVTPPDVVRGFAPPSVRWGAGHRGIDLVATTGQEVRSMAAGTVSFVGVVAGAPVISVRYPGQRSLRSTYEPVTAEVQVGQRVDVGEVIGTVADLGGHCGGAIGCLHIGLRTDATYLDPRTLVERRPAVLKPLP